ncbi:1,4-dihydroxy-2-naphthoate octaprenyltransferase [Flavobacterium sediminilitoris]|uniref:1,4-dihydroxy-2-naphthoate octaprenyltransferase n=1 Tax=Flavobacterium sediminilitoris TaxID=2024526 RepID=A0ABY4HK07_9FLAO|nr:MULTISPECIES: 1,4-dihydroxy-2-naphthoate octaprenyltransferase [Flavobacterium]UOX32903.1 1,4-dihydroxy-2-naphthoate octaprenyltransferase [Flavobacterium sediminilitoris]
MKHWIQAARLRTLPLSISGIIVGSAYAYYQGFFNLEITILALLTTLGLQILSNYANDYGDGVKGTDANRIGEKRLVGSGIISSSQMKKAVIITAIITFIIALSLIYVAFGKENFGLSLIFILLGIGSIGAAIKYTVGSNAYGYSGFGDVFVFVFFGLVSVLGSNFLFTKTFDWYLILPAISIGLLSVAVLNLNNMRDIENDKTSGKNTLVVKLGLKKAKIYHEIIIAIASISFLIFCLITKISLLPILVVNISLIIHLNKIKKSNSYEDFDPELKKVALSTFALSLLFWLTIYFL